MQLSPCSSWLPLAGSLELEMIMRAEEFPDGCQCLEDEAPSLTPVWGDGAANILRASVLLMVSTDLILIQLQRNS